MLQIEIPTLIPTLQSDAALQIASPIKITNYDIQNLLEWAGEKLLSLPVANLKPKPYRSAWPEFKQETNQDFSHKSFRPSPPNGNEIDTLDKIFALVVLIPDIHTRRIIQARSLINPITHRHVYHWLEIGELLNLNRKTLRRKYDSGLNLIATKSNSSYILFLKSQVK